MMSRGTKKLALAVLVIAITWGIILPRLAETETVQERNRWLDQRGIDPAATFYTDLPMMDRILAQDQYLRHVRH